MDPVVDPVSMMEPGAVVDRLPVLLCWRTLVNLNLRNQGRLVPDDHLDGGLLASDTCGASP